MSDYREASTPDLDDVQQLEEPERHINVPVRVTEMPPVRTQALPARDASMRSMSVTNVVQQLVGGNLRRQRIAVWAHTEVTGSVLFIGTDKNQVESGTAAQLHVALLSTEIPPMLLEMSHTLPLWVMASTENAITVSIVTEDWAD